MKTPKANKQSYCISVRFTESEGAKLAKIAKKNNNCSIASLVRDAVKVIYNV